MRSYHVVMPEHLNHFGFLFGGNLLKWVDELSWMAASSDYPGCRFVTIAMDRVEFRKGVKTGSILAIEAEEEKRGRTSVTYHVSVYRKRLEAGEEEQVFSNNVTLVRVDESGRKCALPGEGDAD